MNRLLRATTTALTAIVLAAGSAGASETAPVTEACNRPHDFDTYRVEIAPVARAIKRGEVAKVIATVYRSIDGESDLAPAEGANVVVALHSGDYVRVGGAVTDHHGNALVNVRLGRRFPRGWATASAQATSEPADLPCEPFREAGSTRVERFLKIL